MGVLWYDSIDDEGSENESAGAEEHPGGAISSSCSTPKRVLCTSIYNMIRNSWRSIRLVSPGPSPDMLPLFRFGCTLVPIFEKHVAIREQVEMHKKVQPRAHGP